MKRTLLAVLLLVAAVCPVSAQTKVKIITPGADKQIYLPAKLAEQLGFYKEEGLDVEIFSSTSGSQAATTLLAREVQGVVGAFDHTLDLQSKGKIITSVVQMLLSPGEVELVSTKAPQYADPKTWKGQALGVTGLGSGTDFLTRFMAVRAGLDPREITTVPVGAGDTFIAALQQGKIVAGMTTEPTIGRAVHMGIAKIGIDLRTPDSTREALGGDYPFTCLYMEAAWLAQNGELAQKIVNTQVKTLRWIASHTAEEIADKMPKDYYAGSRDLYVQGLKEAKAMYSPDGLMPESGPASVLRVLSTFSPALQSKTIDLSKTYTNDLVKRVAATH